jgi:thiol-disulfide isomerase/thioredoxin
VSYSYSKNSTPEDINIERNQWYDAVMKEVIYPYLKATFHDRFFRNSEELITVRVGSKFPDFEKYDINNAKISNEDMAGKLTVINFWNIYCGPCIKEMPELHELTIKYNDPDKYNFIAFSSSSAKQIEKLFNRKKDLAFDFRQIPDSQDMEETLGFRFNPVHFVVDPDGIIIFMKVGYTAENIAMIEEVIQNHANSF